MKKTFVLVAGALAVFATAAQAQKGVPVQKQNQTAQVKGTYAPRAVQTPPPAPLVGGSDSCATPDLIVGTGNFAFDNSIATTGPQGQTEGSCLIFGSTAVAQDVWFVWTAPSTGVAVFATCGLTGIDTKIAAYPGTACPTAGTALACNDDACFSFQSQAQFPVTSGNSYVLQLGLYPIVVPPGGAGTFDLNVVVPPSNDDCATPITVTGLGLTAFDNTFASTGAQGQAEGLCFFFGGTAIQNDIWYTWVAPSTGSFLLATEGLTDVDTKASIYNGAGCPGAASIACNDDGNSFDLQTTLVFPATAGNTYTIQLGLYQGTTTGGPGSFLLAPSGTGTEDSCSTPKTITGQGSFVSNGVFATTGVEGQSEVLCTFFATTGIEVDNWFLWTADANGTATISVCPDGFADSKIAVYNGSVCPTAGTSIVCNDDACGTSGLQSEVTLAVVCGQNYLIQVGNYPAGYTNGHVHPFDINVVGSPCSTPFTVFCDGSAIGTTCVACGNNGVANKGCANSVFPGGTQLVSGGIASVGVDTMTLTTSDMTGPGLFFQSSGLAPTPIGFGDGMLCAAVGILRLGVVFPIAGSATYPGGLTPNPISIGGGPIAAGDTKHYQCWYRDAAVFCTASTFNTSNGVTVVWVP